MMWWCRIAGVGTRLPLCKAFCGFVVLFEKKFAKLLDKGLGVCAIVFT